MIISIIDANLKNLSISFCFAIKGDNNLEGYDLRLHYIDKNK